MASSIFIILLLLPLIQCLPITTQTLSQSPPQGATLISNQLTAYSIEFKDFPSFAGTRKQPNQFSITLLQNLAKITGSMPVIRVGGSSQDDVNFVPSQTVPVITGTADGINRAPVTIGPSYFDSWGTFPQTSYIAGINLALNSTNGTLTRQAETSYICRALGSSLSQIEIGNEPDLFIHWNRRPATWGVEDYVAEWKAARDVIEAELERACPLLWLGGLGKRLFAPSFAGTDVGTSPTTLGPLQAFQNGLNEERDITVLSGHNYMASATSPSLQLQQILLNHTAIVRSISSHVTLAQQLHPYAPTAPYLMGETNSLSGGGAAGISNTFGAALWVVDYTLWQGYVGLERVHFHQSGTSPYSSWAPATEPPVTNAPYYGNVLAASAVGSAGNTRIAWVDFGQGDDRISGYTIYEGNQLKRVVALNLIEYLSTSTSPRGSQTFSIKVPAGVKGANVQRLTAAGAEVLDGITVGGVSYDYDLGQGRPVVVDAEAAGEKVQVARDGTLSVVVRDSEGVVLHLF